MDKTTKWTRSLGLMLLGATAFWLPDVCLHAVRAYKFDSRDARIITVVMPLTLFGTFLAVKWARKRTRPGRVGLPMLAGGWLFGGLFMTIGPSFFTKGANMSRQASVVSVVFVLAVTCLAAQVRQNDSKSDVRARIVGAWELVSTEERLTDGSKRPYSDVGAHGKGYLVYTADGHMCAAGMNPDRPAWLDVNNPTKEEKLRAIEGFFGYCGRYEIDAINHVIYHYPEVALDPNAIGTKQPRPYKFDAEKLTFSDKDTAPGILSYAISWKKMK